MNLEGGNRLVKVKAVKCIKSSTYTRNNVENYLQVKSILQAT